MKKLFILITILITFSTNNNFVQAKEIPKIYLKGNINMTSKEEENNIELEYKSKELNFNAFTKIKLQGSSSIRYEKKNYTIKLYEDDTYNNKKKIDLGFGKEHKYHLKANWVDKTHARNIVTARIFSKIQKKYKLFKDTPNYGLIDGFPVEVYINNDFLGLYTLNIPKDEWMFNMKKTNPNNIVIASQDYQETNKFNEEANKTAWEVEVGPNTEETYEKLNNLINFIKNSTNEEFKTNFKNYLNLDATLNYYIMLEYAQLNDNISKNMLLVTYDGKIWYPTLYDLDTSWGTGWDGNYLYDYTKLSINETNKNLLWKKFKETFSQEIANRYFELRQNILTKENVLKEFKKFTNLIPETTLTNEQNKWQNIPGYDIIQIEEFLNTRIPILDDTMKNLYYDILPEVSFKYSTTKKTIKPVEITFTPNRNDIRIRKDGKILTNYTYTLKKNGEYAFEYIDWEGNTIGTINTKIDFIIKDKVIKITISTALIIISLITLYIIYKKKKTKKKQPSHKQKKKK